MIQSDGPSINGAIQWAEPALLRSDNHNEKNNKYIGCARHPPKRNLAYRKPV